MANEVVLRGIVELLVMISHGEDPTIAELLTVVPNLRTLDWINRFGPLSAWEPVAANLATDALAWLTKSLVLAEREFHWLGGSVAAPIWLFRVYAARPDGNADALANWILANRGRNSYVPFGRMTSARSVEEWHAQQRAREQRRTDLQVGIEDGKRRKVERAQEAKQRHEERRLINKERSARLHAELKRLREINGWQRLARIASDAALPLEAIPSELIADCILDVGALDHEARRSLLARIDQRRGRMWRRLRLALTE